MGSLAGGGEGEQLEVGYTLCQDCLEQAMSPRSASHSPRHAQTAQEISHYHWGQFQTYASHVVPSMGPIVSFMTLHDCPKKADQLAKPGNATVNGQCMRVAITQLGQ